MGEADFHHIFLKRPASKFRVRGDFSLTVEKELERGRDIIVVVLLFFLDVKVVLKVDCVLVEALAQPSWLKKV